MSLCWSFLTSSCPCWRFIHTPLPSRSRAPSLCPPASHRELSLFYDRLAELSVCVTHASFHHTKWKNILTRGALWVITASPIVLFGILYIKQNIPLQYSIMIIILSKNTIISPNIFLFLKTEEACMWLTNKLLLL